MKILLATICLLLSACGSEPVVEVPSEPQKTQLEDALSTQLDALEKAKGIEQQVLENSEKRKAQIDGQSR